MKISPSLESVSQDRRPPTHGGAATSFAQLLENGGKARAVLSHRALGFSETGLLGVHFAREQDPSPRPAASASEDRTESGEPLEEQGAAPSPQEARGPTDEVQGIIPGQPTEAAVLSGPAIPKEATVTAAISDRLAAPDTPDQTLAEETHLDPVRPTTPAPPSRSPFRVRLLGDGAELVVVLEGHRWGDESISELEATARAVASEYCMGISHLVVKPNGNGTAA